MDVNRSETQLSILMIGSLIYLLTPAMFWLALVSQLRSRGPGVDPETTAVAMSAFSILWLGGLVAVMAMAILILVSQRTLRKVRSREQKFVLDQSSL